MVRLAWTVKLIGFLPMVLATPFLPSTHTRILKFLLLLVCSSCSISSSILQPGLCQKVCRAIGGTTSNCRAGVYSFFLNLGFGWSVSSNSWYFLLFCSLYESLVSLNSLFQWWKESSFTTWIWTDNDVRKMRCFSVRTELIYAITMLLLYDLFRAMDAEHCLNGGKT